MTTANSSTTGRVSGMGSDLIGPAIAAAFRKLSPRQQFRNPVMFVVFVCSILTTGLWYAVSLLSIAWFTIPLSAGMGMLFLLAQERRALSGTRARSAPPAPR